MLVGIWGGVLGGGGAGGWAVIVEMGKRIGVSARSRDTFSVLYLNFEEFVLSWGNRNSWSWRIPTCWNIETNRNYNVWRPFFFLLRSWIRRRCFQCWRVDVRTSNAWTPGTLITDSRGMSGFEVPERGKARGRLNRRHISAVTLVSTRCRYTVSWYLVGEGISSYGDPRAFRRHFLSSWCRCSAG